MKKRIISIVITMFLLLIFASRYYNHLNELLFYEEDQYSIADPNTRENLYTLMLDSNKNLLDKPKESEIDDIKLNALSAALVDGDSGRVLYDKETHKR